MNLKITVLILGFAMSVHAQFRDLKFEQANPLIDPTSPDYPFYVTAASALPYWTVYLGNVQQTDVLQNTFFTGTASVDIFGPNYPAAGPQPSGEPGVIDGNYTVFLQSGGIQLPSGPALVGASIEQNGTIPAGFQSIEFKTWDWSPTGSTLVVSFNGNTLSPVVIGSGPNYTLWGADISAFAGQAGELEFTVPWLEGGLGPNWIELDDISLSTTAVVPEPSPVILTGIGGLIFALQRRYRQK